MANDKKERILDLIPEELWEALFEEVKEELLQKEMVKKFSKPTKAEIDAILKNI